MMSKSNTKQTKLGFIYFSIKTVMEKAGASSEHGHYVADAICFAHKQGKLNQGLGVYEAIDIAIDMDLLDLTTVPKVVNEGPTWASVDGQRSSGYYCLNIMADLAIEKARHTGIAIVFGGNHNDAGSFSRYVYKAYEQNMMAFSSNNSVPLAAPFGGMENRLSCAPFDAIVPNQSQPPIWTSAALAEFYDADVSEAALQNKPLKGKWLIDPQTGELSDNASKYAKPISGYGRVWDCEAAGQLESPRTYALNMFNEALCAVINPLGIPSTNMPTIDQIVTSNDDTYTTVGGSYFICIDPSVFGDIGAVKARSDSYVQAIRSTPARPGCSVRVPGETGYDFICEGKDEVNVLINHWEPFFKNIAGKYSLNEESLRQMYEASSQS